MIVKVCGITRLEDGLAAVEAGAAMLGFNFYRPSPRYIEPDSCARLVAQLRRHAPAVTLVGVFVNLPSREVAAILDRCGLDLAQLSGDEPPEALVPLAGRAFKAVRPRSPAEARVLAARYGQPAISPALLLDAAADAGRYGGSGQLGDWEAARSVASSYRLLLAGGLRPENVAQAIATVQPWGVDVASGVESSPGRKDVAKMRAFVRAANGK